MNKETHDRVMNFVAAASVHMMDSDSGNAIKALEALEFFCRRIGDDITALEARNTRELLGQSVYVHPLKWTTFETRHPL